MTFTLSPVQKEVKNHMLAVVSIEEILAFERDVCRALEWNLIIPTPLDFLHLLCNDISDDAVAAEVHQRALEQLQQYYACKLLHMV